MQQQIRQAISKCFPRLKPEVKLEPLTGGYSTARIFKFRHGDAEYVVRYIGEQDPEQIQRELVATQIACKLGISPQLIYFNHYLLIMRCIQGRVLTMVDYQQSAVQAKIMQLLNKLSAVPTTLLLPARTYQERIATLIEDIEQQTIVLAQWDDIKQKFQHLSNIVAANRQSAFSHGDPYNTNFIIDDQQVYLVDWHDAGMNYPLVDLAVFSYGLALTKQQQMNLITRVSQQALTAKTWREFNIHYQLAVLQQGLWALLHVLQCHADISFNAVESLAAIQSAYHHGHFDLRHLVDFQRYAAICINYFLTAGDGG